MGIRNKKATAALPEILLYLLVAIIVAVLVISISGTKLKDTGNIIDKTFKCSAPGRYGYCSATCAVGKEIAFEGAFGCPPKENPGAKLCCISMDAPEENEEYGGDTDHNFYVDYVGFKEGTDTNICTKNSEGSIWECKKAKTLHLYVKVTNTGKVPMGIFGNPKVEKDNQPISAADWPFGTPAVIIEPGKSAEITAGELKLDNAAKAVTYKILAAAKCTSQVCKSTGWPNGIFRINSGQYITIITE